MSEEDDDENDNLTQIIDYVRSHPLTLSGLGYFTVSKATLTSVQFTCPLNFELIMCLDICKIAEHPQ